MDILYDIKVCTYKALNLLKRRKHLKHVLNQPSIVIDPQAWTMFDESRFNRIAEEYKFCYAPLDQVSNDSFHNVVAYIGRLDVKLAKSLPVTCKWLQIASHGANGFDDISIYKNSSIVVTRIVDVFSKPIANFCVSSYHLFNSFALRHLFDKHLKLHDCGDSDNSNVLIFGYGNIGCSIAQSCQKQGWKVTGVRRHINPDSEIRIIPPPQALAELKEYDYVINIMPDNKDSVGFFNKSFFMKMKRTAVFCNVGRKSAVIDDDLEYAIENGYLRGAILDAANKLSYKDRRIIVTHHQSSISVSNQQAFNTYYSMQLELFLSGKNLKNRIL